MTTNSAPEKTLYFSLLREQWPPNTKHNGFTFGQAETSKTQTCVEVLHATIFVQSGSLNIGETAVQAGNGCYQEPQTILTNNSNTPASSLRFVISRNAITSDNAVSPFASNSVQDHDDSAVKTQLITCHPFTTHLQDAVLRLDQVDFPPGAIAYRHTHPGAGIRYLLSGGLTLESDHGVQHFQSGEAWFEDQNSPVKATAIDTQPSAFIRAMLLPLEYEAKPTLTLLNAEDKDKPRLQTNTRHNEHRVSIT